MSNVDSASPPLQTRLNVFRRVRESWPTMLEFALVWAILEFTLLGPLSAAILHNTLQWTGQTSLGNFEIATFLLSPLGLLGLGLIGILVVISRFLEVAGLMAILATPGLGFIRTLLLLSKKLIPLLKLVSMQMAVLLILAFPFALTISAWLLWLWQDRDWYVLIHLQPPIFWTGVGTALAIAAVYAVLACRWLIGWSLAMPVLLFEPGVRPLEAMRRSRHIVRGRFWATAFPFIIWFLEATILVSLVLAGCRFLAGWFLDQVGSSPAVAVPAVALVLSANGVVGLLLTLSTHLLLASVLVRLAYQVSPPRPLLISAVPAPRARRGLLVALLALLVLAVGMTYQILHSLTFQDRIEITAHRAGYARAPENTLAALRGAIADGADWAEIDVQRSADGVLVILHDTELSRLGGVNRTVQSLTWKELQQFDVGASVGPEFQGERIPTLEEMIAAAGDRIRLNIELKPHGPDDVLPLTDAVVAAVQKADFIGRCRICSQSYEALQRVREIEPRIEVGFIAGAAVGDLSRREVDFLMLNMPLINRKLVEQCRARGLPVHAWTVRQPDELPRLLDAGVANVITDDPAAIRQRLEEVQQLEPVERLLLFARNRLAE